MIFVKKYLCSLSGHLCFSQNMVIYMCSTGISEVRLLCMKPAKHMQAKGSVIHSFLDGQYSQRHVSILLHTSVNVNLFKIVWCDTIGVHYHLSLVLNVKCLKSKRQNCWTIVSLKLLGKNIVNTVIVRAIVDNPCEASCTYTPPNIGLPSPPRPLLLLQC